MDSRGFTESIGGKGRLMYQVYDKIPAYVNSKVPTLHENGLTDSKLHIIFIILISMIHPHSFNLRMSPYSIFLLIVLTCRISGLQAQVPVHEEPRHRPVFQNKEIRILDVHLPPGDTSQYHIHTTPSLFIRFTSTKTGSQLLGEKASESTSMAGTILFENLAPPDTRTHRVWNADKNIFHVMDVELLFRDTGFVQNPLALPGLRLEIDTPWVRAYRLTLQKGMEFTLSNKNRPFTLVCLDAAAIKTKQNGKTQLQTLIPGSFFDIKRNHLFGLENNIDNTLQFIVLEFPAK
jgi:hypothetical protein